MEQWQKYLESHQDQFLDETLALFRIPSVSTDPAFGRDIRHCAQWVAARLRTAGVDDVRILPTTGHPVVFGQWSNAPGCPTALIYGHYDVQPADPVEQWESPPFEPRISDGKIFARGASDNKGGLAAVMFSIEALLKTTGGLPINVKFLFEGEEETGSPNLPELVHNHRDLLACDFCLSADGSQHSETRPHLIVGCRGICGLQVTVTGPCSDLHSGMHGGAAPNPLQALCRLLSSLHDDDGRIAVPGFYDDVIAPTADDRAAIAAVPFDEQAYREELGVAALPGETGWTAAERLTIRPTLDINGIGGGYQGPGGKTVIPAAARAKLSCRLVPGQDPDTISELISAHLVRTCPPGVTVQTTRLPGTANPYRIPADHPVLEAAAKVLEQLYGIEPYRVRPGASLSICDLFRSQLGAWTVFYAFSLADERQHAPNEFYRISSWSRAQRAYCLLLNRLAES